MNYGIVLKVLGSLLLFEAGFLLFPLGISMYYRESDTLAFVYSIIALLGVGVPMVKFSHSSRRIKAKEALTIVVGGWVLVSFFGSLPFVLSGSIPSFIDAFFETVSGLTTTGATIIDDIEVLPRGILFWRSLTHWLGGMGILVLTLAILPVIGVGGFQIFKAESPGPVSDKLVPKMKDTAKILYTVYLGITILQTVLLYVGGMSLYEALVHTFGTLGTGGFSTRNSSIGAFNSYIQIIIAIFMIASGINFSLYYDLYKGRWKEVVKNSELKLYLSIIVVAIILITINLNGRIYTSLNETFRYALFQVSSIITTTGYGTADFDQWPTFSKGILFMLMFVGGCAGSTGGSIKVIRLLVLFKLVRREISKILHPRAFIPVKINNKSISPDVTASVASFFFLYMLIFVAGTLLISLEGIGLISAASSVAATLGNIGPGFELVGPAQTYSQFSVPSKLLFSLLMLFGRLELFTVFILLMPTFWRDR
ncbi:potassium uptake protein, TrkH family [Alkaliphilus metalliredigens QYMF]|uniref:Potassium uptake protein, TrkH family n=1 Tax=Alkaliphilus metalliredigens (strain QYMF) TaxID=293826 RepID=A6TWB9_ALKMQ|nr:TrkH family potassium uptake protein [Alkaliphilus metalliredigens]ABR50487.1 potassium uptake protein, TrkH family [Alkaliphilus metalliredigens QYMF]